MGNDNYRRPVLTNRIIQGNRAIQLTPEIRFGSGVGQPINCLVCENQGSGEQVSGGSHTTTAS
jgi:hypothetical protein